MIILITSTANRLPIFYNVRKSFGSHTSTTCVCNSKWNNYPFLFLYMECFSLYYIFLLFFSIFRWNDLDIMQLSLVFDFFLVFDFYLCILIYLSTYLTLPCALSTKKRNQYKNMDISTLKQINQYWEWVHLFYYYYYWTQTGLMHHFFFFFFFGKWLKFK